ncbi:MAG: GNAT family N-acetyltransferase [Acidimicrobiales bacterium]
MDTEVRDANERRRYEIFADGKLAGFAEYQDIDDTRVFTHTEIDEAYEGRGLGGILVRAALDDADTTARSIVALCPFVRHTVDEHPEYQPLVDQKLDARLRRRST